MKSVELTVNCSPERNIKPYNKDDTNMSHTQLLTQVTQIGLPVGTNESNIQTR
jgi:hypothetical protein